MSRGRAWAHGRLGWRPLLDSDSADAENWRAALGVYPEGVRVAIDYFLRIDGVPGESIDDKHKGEIDVEAWSWGESNPRPPEGVGGGAGKGRSRTSTSPARSRRRA